MERTGRVRYTISLRQAMDVLGLNWSEEHHNGRTIPRNTGSEPRHHAEAVERAYRDRLFVATLDRVRSGGE